MKEKIILVKDRQIKTHLNNIEDLEKGLDEDVSENTKIYLKKSIGIQEIMMETIVDLTGKILAELGLR